MTENNINQSQNKQRVIFFSASEDSIYEPEPLSFPDCSSLSSPTDDTTFHLTHLHDDENLEHLDFNREDQLADGGKKVDAEDMNVVTSM